MSDKKKIGKKKAPQNETPEQKVVRLTTPRVKKIIKSLRQIQTTVRGRYNPVSQTQITTMVELITKELVSLQTAFDSRSKSTDVEEIEVNL